MKRRNDSDMKRSKERYMYKSRIKRKKKSEKKLSFIENGLKIIKPLRQRLPTLSYLQFNLLNKYKYAPIQYQVLSGGKRFNFAIREGFHESEFC